MGNCLVTKLIETVDNPNLPLFGLMRVYVDTYGATDNIRLYFLGDPVGTKIEGAGTFTDNTTEITQGSQVKYVAPDTRLTLLVPKYTCMPNPSMRFLVGTAYHSTMTFNTDDLWTPTVYSSLLNYITLGDNNFPWKGDLLNLVKCCPNFKAIYNTSGTRLGDLVGDVKKICDAMTYTEITDIKFHNTGISGNINEALTRFPALTELYINDSNISGDISVCFRNMVQANAEAFKARTDYLFVACANSKCTDYWFGVLSSHRYIFSGTSTVTITNYNGTVTLGTYDIDTDTFTPTD